MIETIARAGGVTLGSDEGYDTAEHAANLRLIGVTPHVAQSTTARRFAIDASTTRYAGYAISQRIRERIEESFGCISRAPAFARLGIEASTKSGGCSH